ncbi:DUF6875 domain-containing protein [Streptomyces sp. HD1123-B1]|uniref:DUF6875 domain-containing protein n=1 Tax=Streptomyces huangiella TaxID=3228804 RepID=UPI003D7C652F
MSHPNAAAAGLGTYATAAARHCPYLSPSMRSAQTLWVHYRVHADTDLETVEAAVFAAGVAAAECVRTRRTESARMACTVAAFELGPSWHERALTWPHWALKAAYVQVGVVAGKFWPDQSLTDRRGLSVPSPPLPLLALRASVPTADVRLLGRTPRLATVLPWADDDGRDVFAGVGGLGQDPGETWRRVRSWAAEQLEGEGTDVPGKGFVSGAGQSVRHAPDHHR